MAASSEFQSKAYFYLGVSHFFLEEYDIANTYFSKYLQSNADLAHFEDTMKFKFAIAEQFREGARLHLLGFQSLPKWGSGAAEAIVIYDEVIAAMPASDIAAESLYAKAFALRQQMDWKQSIESLQLLLRRFPKHELAPCSYLAICETYYEQCQYERQNADILAMAEVALRKYADDFPKDHNITQAREYVQGIKELNASGLCETGLFYERKGKPESAAIYYENTINSFPDTKIAGFCKSRLDQISQSEPLHESE